MPEVLQPAWGCIQLFPTCEKFRGIGKEEKKIVSIVARAEVAMEIPKRNLSQSMKNYNRDILVSAI